MKLTTTFLIVITLCFVGCDLPCEHCDELKQKPLYRVEKNMWLTEPYATQYVNMKVGDTLHMEQYGTTIIKLGNDDTLSYVELDRGEVPTHPSDAPDTIIIKGDAVFGDKIINNKK